MSIQAILDKAGHLEILDGESLQTKEYLISNQKYWPDDDTNKNYDFSDYDYWVTGECETGLYIITGVKSIEEGLLEILGIEKCRRFGN